jgi:thiamine pyrophosphate-dependent acetolactate synthase large subunit-like protein
MANGSACAHGGIGVAAVTHGPTLTKTITALGEAVPNETPLVFVAGDTAVDDPGHPQNIAQCEFLLRRAQASSRFGRGHSLVDDVACARSVRDAVAY